MDNDGPKFFALVLGAVLVIFAVGLAIWGVTVGLSDMFGAGNAHKQTHGDATYRNAMHDKFYQDCAGIQGLEGTIEVNTQALKDDAKAGVDVDTLRRDRENIAGPKAQRLRAIAEYNADADNVDRAGLFRSIDLPSHINPNQEHTTCAS